MGSLKTHSQYCLPGCKHVVKAPPPQTNGGYWKCDIQPGVAAMALVWSTSNGQLWGPTKCGGKGSAMRDAGLLNGWRGHEN
jgi:hypothetical protein